MLYVTCYIPAQLQYDVLVALAELSAKYVKQYIKDEELEDVGGRVKTEFIRKFDIFTRLSSYE